MFLNYLLPSEAKILAAMSYGYQLGVSPHCNEGGMVRAWKPSELMVMGARKLMSSEIQGKKFHFEHLKFNAEKVCWDPRDFGQDGKPVSKVSASDQKEANLILKAITDWDVEKLKSIVNEPKIKSFFAKLNIERTENKITMDTKTVQEGISVSDLMNETPEAMAEMKRGTEAEEKTRIYADYLSDKVSLAEFEKVVNNDINALNERIKAAPPPQKASLGQERDKLMGMLQKKRNASPDVA